MKVVIGAPGKGKTQLVLYYLTEVPTVPKLGISQIKKVVVDGGDRCEAGCAFAPMQPWHILYKKLRAQGREPRGYKVEVLSPLSWTQGEPEFYGEQPAIFHPFVFAVDRLTMEDWFTLLGISRNRGQRQLHLRVIDELNTRGTLAETTIPEMIAIASDIGRDEGRSLPGLLDAYDSLNNTGLVLPREYAGQKTPWLDMKAVLDDTETMSVFHLPPNDEDRAVSFRVTTVILRMIRRLKRTTSTGARVDHPVILGVPELANLAKKKLEEGEKEYLEPLKATVYQLFRVGTGNGISIIADSQFLKGESGLDPIVNETSNAIAMFYLDKQTINEQLNQRMVRNRWALRDESVIGKLNRQGHFIWVGAGSVYGEAMSGAIPSWHYPRMRMGRTMDTFGYRDLWARIYPYSSHKEMYHDVGVEYALSRQIRDAGEAKADLMLAELRARLANKKGEPADEKVTEITSKFKARCLKVVEKADLEGVEYLELETAELADLLADTRDTVDPTEDIELLRKRMASTAQSFAKALARLGPCIPKSYKHRASYRFKVKELKELLEKAVVKEEQEEVGGK